MKSCLSIAFNTIQENLREPIYLLLILTALSLLAILPIFGALFTFGDSSKVIADSGLGMLMFIGWLTAAFSASQTITGEINRGIVLNVLSKPVQHSAFFFGKLLGIFSLILLFSMIVSVAIFISIQITTDNALHPNTTIYALYLGAIILSCLFGGICNYLAGTSFCKAAIIGFSLFIPLCLLLSFAVPQGNFPKLHTPLFPALLLIIEAILIMSAFAIAVSTRCRTGQTLFLCFLLFFCGLFADYLSCLYPHSLLCDIMANCLPNWQSFWMADVISAKQTIQTSYMLKATGSACLLCLFYSILGYTLFRHREIATGVSLD